jgi:hypothetical protein
VPQPDLVMGRENELRIRKALLKEGANLTAMAGVNRHQHVVQHGEGEVLSKQHQGQVEAEPHAVLMALAVIGAWREVAGTVEIVVEAKAHPKTPYRRRS